MKTFSFQIQFSPLDNQEARERAIGLVLRLINKGMSDAAATPYVDRGEDCITITPAIARPLEFWNFAEPNLPVQAVKLIVVANGGNGWDDYLLLYHFDANQCLDDLPSDGSDAQTM